MILIVYIKKVNYFSAIIQREKVNRKYLNGH